jgi:mono/diheme cytochrome c family protein
MRKGSLPNMLPNVFSCVVSRRFALALVPVIGLHCVLLTAVGKLQAAPASSLLAHESEEAAGATAVLAGALGIRFVENSTSSVIVERDGQEYFVDLASRTIRENDARAAPAATVPQQAAATTRPADTSLGIQVFQQQCSMCHGDDGKGLRSVGTPDFTDRQVQARLTDEIILNTIRNGRPGTAMPAWAGKLSDAEIRAVAATVRSLGSGQQIPTPTVYEPADDFVYTLPTGRRLTRHGLYVNFTHRFAYDPAFSGAGRGNMLLGLDGFAVSSFGFRYGVTNKLSISAYRSPSTINRPIELMAAYHLLDEHDGNPLNLSFRVSIDGQNDFSKNFTTNFEGIVSRSLSRHAQLYIVPTVSIQNRRLISKPGALPDVPPNLPGINSFSLGVGGAFDIRPTVALVADVSPTLANGRELGIHRPAYGFGIQKRLRRHAFTLGFSNNPGTVVSQRAGTNATFLSDPSADKPKGLFIGFDLMRQLY